MSLKRVQASVLLETAEALAFVSERTGKSISDLAGLCIDVGMLDRDGLPDYLEYCGYDLDAQLLLEPSTASGQPARSGGCSAPASLDERCTLPSTKGYEGEARGNLGYGSALFKEG